MIFSNSKKSMNNKNLIIHTFLIAFYIMYDAD